ncbi:MAG: hypothetical protein J6K36_02975 [Bacilli bacterium]|nr:hypothetical protein [Bacilli bacterium]
MTNIIKNINKTKFLFFFKYIAIFLLVVFIINIMEITYSKYSSSANGDAVANIAFFIVDVGTYENTISLNNLEPSNNDYIYKFTVNNFKNNKRTNVKLDYNLEFVTTTNLPLTYKIYKEGTNNIITSNEIIQDGDMYFNKLSTNEAGSFSYEENQTEEYTLVVNFPITYNDKPDEYQGLIDSFMIKINATQRV